MNSYFVWKSFITLQRKSFCISPTVKDLSRPCCLRLILCSSKQQRKGREFIYNLLKYTIGAMEAGEDVLLYSHSLPSHKVVCSILKRDTLLYKRTHSRTHVNAHTLIQFLASLCDFIPFLCILSHKVHTQHCVSSYSREF